jgi:hypothetical protein
MRTKVADYIDKVIEDSKKSEEQEKPSTPLANERVRFQCSVFNL